VCPATAGANESHSVQSIWAFRGPWSRACYSRTKSYATPIFCASPASFRSQRLLLTSYAMQHGSIESVVHASVRAQGSSNNGRHRRVCCNMQCPPHTRSWSRATAPDTASCEVTPAASSARLHPIDRGLCRWHLATGCTHARCMTCSYATAPFRRQR